MTNKRVIPVALAFSGHPVRFQLVNTAWAQYVAYYDADRYLTVAQRDRPYTDWTYHVIPEVRVGWDSHCNIEMVSGPDGYLHLCANMHGNQLVYYRTARPGNVETLVRSDMTGDREDRCTYPRFVWSNVGGLIFTYRYGTCGDGDTLVKEWEDDHWEQRPDMFHGEGRRSNYHVGPFAGNIAYCWRESPDPQTNHTLGYARTSDFHTWERADGTKFTGPITLDTTDVIDSVAQHGGMLNGNMQVGYDATSRVVVSYHKFDENGLTQIYNARYESDHWEIYQMTDWKDRWDFSGDGTLPLRFKVPQLRSNIQGSWIVNEGMQIIGKAPARRNKRWRLSHSRLPANNDRPREETPEPSMLRVIYD